MGTDEVFSLESLAIGCRFSPTDEELLNDYLKPKIKGKIKANSVVIPEVDVCKFEPWHLPEKSLIKSKDSEWFFFAPKYRKYPNGRRSNRATEAGYWKSTGIDRSIRSSAPSPMDIGMKKILVFHRGRAPKGERSGWIIHEYRTVEPEFDQGGFVICQLFKKPEESILISNDNNFSPDIRDTTAQGDDALYETAPPQQEIVHPNWPETVDESMKKSEETHSNSDISADNCASGICMDNLKDGPDPSNLSSLNLGFDQPSDILAEDEDDDDNNCIGASLEDEDDDFNKLLASMLDSDEERLSEFNKFLENTTESLPSTQVCPIKPETFLDNTSGIGSIIGDNADVEVLLPQDAPALAASYQMSVPISPSSYLMPLTPNLYEFDALSVDVHYPQNSTANELQSMNSFNGNVIFEDSDDNGVGASLKHKDDEIAELLAAILAPVEEFQPEFNKFLGNTTESVPSTQVCPTKPETFLDNILPQEAPALASSYQMSAPISRQSYLMPLTPNSYEFDTLSVDVHYPQNSTANELQSMDSFNGNVIFEDSDPLETLLRASDLSQDQFKNEPNPSGADNSTGIGIKLRPPKKRTSANLNQLGSRGMAAHGKPRIRLQTSLRIGSTVITNRNSTSSNKDHDEKAEISESGNNAEVEMPKMAYLGPSDNDVLSSSNNFQTKEPNELCLDPESALKKAPKAASINFGSVTVVLPVILCVLCIGIGWFFSYR